MKKLVVLIVGLLCIGASVTEAKANGELITVEPNRQKDVTYNIFVDVAKQEMKLIDDDGFLVKTFQIATGSGGISSVKGSKGTPSGNFVIGKIGRGAYGELISGFQPTGKLQNIVSGSATENDMVFGSLTTRVMELIPVWGRTAEKQSRQIRIHGTANEHLVLRGINFTGGCVAMLNADIIFLDNWIRTQTDSVGFVISSRYSGTWANDALWIQKELTDFEDRQNAQINVTFFDDAFVTQIVVTAELPNIQRRDIPMRKLRRCNVCDKQ